MATSSENAGRHAFSELYARWALNPLVDVAQAVAHDVAVRPHLYRALDPHVVECIAGFRHRMGTSPEWPDAFQRTLSFKPLYQVSVASPPIRAAAIHCASEPDSAPLMDQFRETVKVFSDHLRGFTGDALNMLCEQSRPIFEQAVCLLQSEAVANAFGVKPAPQRDWPVGLMAAKGAILVSTIAQTLKGTRCLVGSFRRLSRDSPIERRLAPALTVALPVEKVLSLQRAAHWGAKTSFSPMTRLRTSRTSCLPRINGQKPSNRSCRMHHGRGRMLSIAPRSRTWSGEWRRIRRVFSDRDTSRRRVARRIPPVEKCAVPAAISTATQRPS